jgi:hypothetical protein
MKNLKGPVCLGLLLGTVSVALAAPMPGQLSARYKIDPANPEAVIPPLEQQNADPLEFGYLVQDLIAFAEAAKRAGDHGAEARYDHAFSIAVPTEAIAFRRLCEAFEAGGRRAEAQAACRDALGRRGVQVEDFVHFVRLSLAKPAPMTADELKDVSDVIDHLLETPNTRVFGAHLQCELALHDGDTALLESCTSRLKADAPQDPKTISFEWALAIRKGDRGEAHRLIGEAKATGMKPEGVARMQEQTDKLVLKSWMSKWVAPLLVTVALATALVVSLVFARRRRGLRQRLA